MTTYEIDILLTKYGFVEQSHPVYDIFYKLVLNDVQYIFRESTHNYYIVGNVQVQQIFSIPFDIFSENLLLDSSNIDDFKELYQHFVSIKRKETIDNILNSL